MDWMPQAVREGILTVLFISGPLVILAAGLGLTIGVLQAATQVQEQTLGSAAKILGIFLALIIFGFYIFQYLSRYAEQNISRAFRIVPTLGAHPMPRKNPFDKPITRSDELEDNEPIPFRPPVDTIDGALPSGRSPLASSLDISGPGTVDVNVGQTSEQQLPGLTSLQRPTFDEINTQDLTLQVPNIEAEAIPEPAAPVAVPAPVVATPTPVAAPATSPAPRATTTPPPARPVAQTAPPATTPTPPAKPKTIRRRERPSSGIERLKKSIKEFESATSGE